MAEKKKAVKQEHEKKKQIVKEPIPELRPGMTVKVHQKITETGPKGEKERVQIFEGMILAHKHGKQPGATITVRKISEGVGVEKIFPLNSPTIIKVEPIKQAKVRKSKLFYLRDYGKRLSEKAIPKK